jgi:Asp-tRNA(Asn)/Glu-tRNA(Gln) amidotransferase A subunit family amidase
MPFTPVEATIEDIHRAFASRELTPRQLVQAYLDRIEAIDRRGPALNSIITVNPRALEEADRLRPGGSLYGIPVILKDQIDAAGMPTTLGSVLFRDFRPDHDAFATKKLKDAGAVILAKATLGELGGGDTFGSLFGATKNPYALDRTPGGSSGGPAAAVAASLGAVALGQESLASIRRPAAWNCLVGMRPTAGLVSRAGVYEGWPRIDGVLGPLCRTVGDAARVLEAIAGYDAEDPVTAAAFGRSGERYASQLDRGALKGARLGILRESMGSKSEPGADDFKAIDRVFDRNVKELREAGAEVVDPIVIPRLKELLATRPGSFSVGGASFEVYMARNAKPPFRVREEAIRSPEFSRVEARAQKRWTGAINREAHYAYLVAREQLMFSVLKVMADHRLDAIVHKGVEHAPTLLAEGHLHEGKGAPHINTFLVFVPSISVPSGFTPDGMPAGLCFLGRPYDDAKMIRLAYAYEQATLHRRPPPGMD